MQNVVSVAGRRSSSNGRIQIAEVPDQDPARSIGSAPAPTPSIDPGADKENDMPGSKRSERAPKPAQPVKTPITRHSSAGPSTQRTRSLRSAARFSDNVTIHTAAENSESGDEALVAILNDSGLDDTGLKSSADQQEGVSLMTAQEGWQDNTMELVAVLDDSTMHGNDSAIDNGHLANNSGIDPRLLTQASLETPGARSANIKKKRDSFKTPVTMSSTQAPPAQSTASAPTALPTPTFHSETPANTTSIYPATPLDHTHPASEQSWNAANLHDEEDETYLQPTSPVMPTPKTVAPKNKSRKKKPAKAAKRASATRQSSSGATRGKKRKTTSSSTPQGTDNDKSNQKGKKQSKGTTFPVLCRRLRNASALPTIVEETEPAREKEYCDENEYDEASAEQPPASAHVIKDRQTPNSVDILAQFCLENLDNFADNIINHGSTNIAAAADVETSTTTPRTSRTSTRNRTTALTILTHTIESRLADLSIQLDHRMDLEAAVRASSRRAAEAKTRWIGVRQERETIQRQIDDVKERIAEWEDGLAWKRTVSEGLWRWEGEVGRGKKIMTTTTNNEKGNDAATVAANLEYRLTTAAAASGPATLARRVKAFNDSLEASLAVWESGDKHASKSNLNVQSS